MRTSAGNPPDLDKDAGRRGARGRGVRDRAASNRRASIVSSGRALAIWVLVGVPLLLVGFAINPGPPIGDKPHQLLAYGLSHHTTLTLGGWLQVTGTVMTSVFAIGMVVRSRRVTSIAGLLVLAGSIVLIAVGLSELTAYKVLATGHLGTVRMAADLIPGVQLGYSIVAAPAIFGGLAYLILRRQLLPEVFGWAALGLALVFWVCGLVTVVKSIQGFIDVLSGVQAVWWLAAGGFVAMWGLPLPERAIQPTAP